MDAMQFNTKSDFLYESLKDEIIEGKLRSGERIIISDVAKRYNVSPMPIREAINRLQQDGFVEVKPHVGARVAPFDPERHKELMLIRTELEALAVRLSAEHIDEETLQKLEDNLKEMEECFKTKNNKKYGKLNREFHLTLYGANPYKILYELITSLWARSEFSRGVFERNPERNETSLAEHKAIVEALKNGDGEKAAQILRKQKIEATAMYMKHYEESMQ
ncbi:MAG: GntR family transcriptional regulator [Clostridia bacterium]|nr:GntR family transcriptional regulator [Clostridia bacterium]